MELAGSRLAVDYALARHELNYQGLSRSAVRALPGKRLSAASRSPRL